MQTTFYVTKSYDFIATTPSFPDIRNSKVILAILKPQKHAVTVVHRNMFLKYLTSEAILQAMRGSVTAISTKTSSNSSRNEAVLFTTPQAMA
jgi:hypothetical protein